jgi:heptosyltransferase-2
MNTYRFLLIRTGGLGDSVLLWPAISALRRKHPKARIDLMGYGSRLRLMVSAEGADRALDVEGSGLHLLYEVAADLPEEVKAVFGAYTHVIAFAALDDYSLAENLAACGVKEVHAFLPFPSDETIHMGEHYLSCLAQAGCATQGPHPLLPVGEQERQAAKALLESAGLVGMPLVMLGVGSGSKNKNWPASGYIELVRSLFDGGWVPVLLEGPADELCVAQVKDGCPRPPVVLADHNPSLLKGLLSFCSLYIGHDSGPTHLAALIGTKTMALVGPKQLARWHPLGPQVKIIVSRSSDVMGIGPPEVIQVCQETLANLKG